MNSTRDNTESFPDEPDDGSATEDLVAFLDGELDPRGNEAIEAKIGVDPSVRAEVDAYKKTWDLLDYLPRPEPSPDFTERTMSRLEPVRQSASGNLANGPMAFQSGTAVLPPQPSNAMTAAATPRSPRQKLIAVVLWLTIFGAAGFGGYFAREKVVEHIARVDQQERRIEDQERVTKERRLLQNLPLYRLVDDLDFARQLNDPELFGDEPGTIAGSALAGSNRLHDGGGTADDYDQLRRQLKYFQSLPEARQEQIRALDREFHELDDDVQARLRLVLERYNYWLAYLPEEDRRRVETSRPGRRIEIIEELRDRDWVQTLPKPYREKYESSTTNAERRHFVKEWRQVEKDRSDEWEFVRRNEPKAGGLPAFIGTPKDKADFDLFALNLESQLPPGEAALLRRSRAAAEQDGSWLEYALVVAKLSDRHPLLPGPTDGPKNFGELPEDVQKYLIDHDRAVFGGMKKKALPETLNKASGRWPEFAVAVSEYTRAKGWPPLPKQLGPVNKDDKEMPAEVRTFIDKVLEPTLARNEKSDQRFVAAQAKKDHERLRSAQGMWPDYPRTVNELARQYRLPIPGWTLPNRAILRPEGSRKSPRDPAKG